MHRATAVPCEGTRDPGFNSGPDGGLNPAGGGMPCGNDYECAAGRNGRCQPTRSGHECNYDDCAADGECVIGAVCQCGASAGALGRAPHACLPRSTCRLDSDCGTDGYCSPSWDVSCGSYWGVVGWFCHQRADTCVADDDCKDDQGTGFCAYDPTVAHWICSYSGCAG